MLFTSLVFGILCNSGTFATPTASRHPVKVVRKHKKIVIDSHRTALHSGPKPPTIYPKKTFWLFVWKGKNKVFLFRGSKPLKAYWVSVGISIFHPTPIGWFSVKEIDWWCDWNPSYQTRMKLAKVQKGFPMSGAIPGGSRFNALGAGKLVLNDKGWFLCHGNNNPNIIGSEQTLGCVEFGNADIAEIVAKGIHVGSKVFVRD